MQSVSTATAVALLSLGLATEATAADEPATVAAAADVADDAAPAFLDGPQSALPDQEGAAVRDSPANPPGPDASAPSERPGPREQARGKRLVYACRDGTLPVFSDRPCNAVAEIRRIDLPPPRTAGAVPSTRIPAAAATTRPIVLDPRHDEAARAADRCERLADQLAAVDARMRAGYSAREAARLWQRWRDVKEKLHNSRCSGAR
jgi:hypothetical protein